VQTGRVVEGDAGSSTGRDATVQELARGAVARALGRRVPAREVEVVHSTDSTAVVLVRSAGAREGVVVKLARLPGSGTGSGTNFARTAAVIGLARAVGVPAPTVLAVDTSGRPGAWQYLMQEHIGGIPWRQVKPLLDERQLDAAHREIAEAVLAMQTIRFDGFGELDRTGRPAGVTLLDGLRQRADRILQLRDRDAFLELLGLQAPLFDAPHGSATLTHDDLHHGNVLFARRADTWRLAGLIDWDKAWSGSRESDVARMAFWDDMTGPGFWQVYDRAASFAAGWEHRFAIYQLLWCLEYDDGTDRHIADTAGLWHRLGGGPP
jgi:aminoglycoside phosphotransferase (APT) family kinase protein